MKLLCYQGTDKLGRAELQSFQHAVAHIRGAKQKTLADTAKLLQGLDSDGDGAVSMREFRTTMYGPAASYRRIQWGCYAQTLVHHTGIAYQPLPDSHPWC